MNKSVSFSYGIISYLIFLLSFVYAIGFLGEFIVPKTINSGTTSTLFTSLVMNSILLGLFAIQHTVMARPGFKKWFTHYIPAAIERSTFVLFSSLLLFLLYWQWQPLPQVIWQIDNPLGQYFIWFVFALGWLIVLLSTFMINHFDLFGLRQVWLNLHATPYTHVTFQKTALYKHIRHPIMLGFIIAFWATPTMTWGHLLFALATTIYIVIGIQFEEHDLLNAIGEEYAEYRQQVSMLIPRKKNTS